MGNFECPHCGASVLLLTNVTTRQKRMIDGVPKRGGVYRIDEMLGTFVYVPRPTPEDRARGLYGPHNATCSGLVNKTQGGTK